MPTSATASGSNSSTGAVHFDPPALYSNGFGKEWGLIYDWSSVSAYSNGSTLGKGFVNLFQPTAHQTAGGGIMIVSSATDVLWFDSDGSGGYVASFFGREKLVVDGGDLVLTDTEGNVTRFHGFGSGVPTAQRGKFKSFADPFGNLVTTTYDAAGLMTAQQRSDGTATETYAYSYIASGVNAGLLAGATLSRSTGGGPAATVRKVAYEYYDGVKPGGNARNLQLEKILDASNNVIDTSYFRYYTVDGGVGYKDGMKYVFHPEAYARLAANVANPTALSDAAFAPHAIYADNYFEYDADHRVVKSVVQGAGCSCAGSNGEGEYTYSYSTSPFAGTAAGDYNTWYSKTIEILPDGNQNLYYHNFAGEPILKVFHNQIDTADPSLVGKVWATSYRYDEVGRLIQTAQPSAVKITSMIQLAVAEFYPDLVGFDSADNSYQYLRADSGVIHLIEYGTSKTATATAPGDVKGLLKGNQIQNGYAGTPIPLDAYKYFEREANGIEIYPLASSTVYAEAGGAGARMTTYAYTWFGSSNQAKSVEVTYPTVAAAHNGPGTADVETTVHDVYGRPIWFRDAAGFLHYTAYDNATGAVIKTIVDVDTARTGDFANLPAGWSTPSGGGLHLIDSYQVDGLGRTVKAVDPDGRVTHWVYNDANHEVRVYRGWNAATGTATGPIEVARLDPGRGYDETFTMATAPALAGSAGSYVPTGAESIANLRSLSRTIYDLGGRVVEQDDYFNLSGLTYSASTVRLGTVGANYYATQYGYDKRGRLSRVVDAVGTITATAHDSLGRVARISVGTADGFGGTGPDNTKVIAGYQYDGGGVGDGNLTRETQYPDGFSSTNDRVTEYAHDWRNRLVATKEGVQSSEGNDVQRRIVFLDLNNLGEVAAVSLYAANGVAVSTAKPDQNRRLAYTTYAYDEWGRVYDERTYSLNPSTGAATADFLQTLTYYDRLGRAAAVRAPGGLVSKVRYDGAGRLVVSAQTDGAGGTSWAAAMTLDGDHVLTETRTRYNRVGDPIQVTTLERNHDALASATGPLFAPGAPELNDLGFETVAVAPGSFVYGPSGSAWSFAGAAGVSAGVSANGSGFTSGNRNAPEGNQVAFLQGLGAISQTSTEWLAGTHAISFKAAQRGNWTGTQSFKLQVDGVDVDGATFTPSGTAYQTFSATFSVTAGRHVISFVGLDASGVATAFIDDVSITLGAFAPALGDPGFEDAVVASGSFVYGPSDSAWTFAGNTGVSANDSAFTSGNPDAPQGNQILFLQAAGAASQTISLQPGTYTVSFLAAQRENYSGEQTIQFKVNGVLVASFKPAGYDYEAFSATFTLTTAGTYTLSLAGTDVGGTATAFVDAVSIAAADARVSHAAFYYDAARRLVGVVDVGTNGGLPFVRPATVPTRSDSVLLTSHHYNDAGLVDQTTDPDGLHERTLYDALGRPVQVVANASASQPNPIGAPTASANNTTLYAYDGLDRVLTVTAVTPTGTPDQTTTYVYGVSTATGSLVNSNGLLWKIVQPDASAVVYAHDALGEVVSATDANGTVHSYAYDVLGRLRSDAATTLGTGVDGAVRRVATDYDALGRAFRFTTYNAAAGGTIVNQVERVFNGFGQITAEYQEHSGAVNTATSPKVQYDYAMANGGSRLVKMTYPTGSRFLQYQYNAGIDNNISRVSAIADSAVAGVGVVESYHYLGLGTIVQRDQPQINERLTYIRRPTDAAAAGNDRYSGLDRFGRVIDQNWVRTAATAGGAAGTSSVRLQYQYDRAGNALSRLDLVDAALSELYEYDDLDRLTSFQRGVPSDPPTLQQSWDLDALGNWSGITTGGTTTNRQFNVGNQTTSVSGGTAPTYDANGNVATKDGQEFKYDAWGRLASVKAVGGSVLAQYTHDALGRRAVERYPGVFTTHVYFTPDWRVVEERTDATTHLTVLGATGQIILRDVYSGGAPNEDWRYYPRQNANGDIVALIKGAAPNAGRVLERYAYEPYGAMVVMAGDGTPRPGGTAYSWRVFFQGGRVDNVSGLYNFQRRDYDPSSGVWMTRDPIGLRGGDLNLYRFVSNNPVNFIDPTGLSVWDRVVAGAQVVGGGLEIAAGFAVGAGVGWTGVGLIPAAGLGVHGADQMTTGLAGLWSGEARRTRTATGVTAVAAAAGASPQTSELIGDAVDTYGPMAMGGLGGAAIRRAAAGGLLPGAASGGPGRGTPGAKPTGHPEVRPCPPKGTPSKAIAARDALVAQARAAGHCPSTISAAEDISTGTLCVRPSAAPPAVVAPELVRAARPLGGVGTKTACGNTVGACSEFQAANELCLGGSRLKDIRITPAVRPRTGQVIPRCDNCKAMFGSLD